MTVKFIHLRVHTEFSLVDGLVRIDDLVQHAAKEGMPAVAVTDQANMFAAVKFYQAAEKAGVKPIMGAELWLENPEDIHKPFSFILLCQNNTGYLNLTQIISRGYTQGQQAGMAQIKREWIAELHEGLIALSGGRTGDLGHALLNQSAEEAQLLLNYWISIFGNRYYIELQRTGREQEDEYIKLALDIAYQANVPVVATNDVRFIAAEDFDAHEARVCIHDGYTLDDPKRPRLYSSQQYLRSPKEMQSLFADIPEALANTVAIAKRCNATLTLGKVFLPDFPIPAGYTSEEYFAEQSRLGLEKRLTILLDRQAENFAEKRIPYDERLQVELDVINKMGFAGYFLIVADFIQWSKNNGIPVGPGRGSGAGSLVAYALGITDLDPLQYDLLFERFLNPERVSMPDFDVDFCMDGRDAVIEYVAQKYGRHCVSQIITYGTMAAKAVIRDVGRVLGHPYGFVDKIAKLIPMELGITLEKALADEPALRDRYQQEEDVAGLIDLALKLEGITRNAGKHAGGVVIAPTTLTDFSPLFCEPGSDHYVTQFDKDDVESVGLVKFDFLGLRTLTIINWAVQNVNARLTRENQPLIDINLIPVDDTPTYDLLKACATTAVFQLESRGMKDLIKRLQPDCFEDIIALVALFRPGPLQSGMVDDFIDRKHGRALVEYPHLDLEPILRPTYGVILYQEQVMQIAQVLANYTLGGADLLRRAMGKKKPEEMAKQRELFVNGASDRGVDAQLASDIFDLMEKFAGYGFNKSHSAAYALVAYQTAWLKAHYPAEFMAAVLSSDMDNTDKVVIFIDECHRMQLPISPPNINQGQYRFTVDTDGIIVYGLGAIKGVGEAVVDLIVQEREQHGSYSDLFDFCRRIDLRKANKRVLEALICSGAMDCFGIDRAVLMASVESAVQLAEAAARNHSLGQADLFGLLPEEEAPAAAYVNAKPWSETKRLQGEKNTLGMYFSGHPIEQYQAELATFISSKIINLEASYDKSVVIAGFVVAMRTLVTKRGDRMAFMSLDDRTGRIEIAVFSDVLAQCRDTLTSEQLLVVEGEVSVDDFNGGLRMSARRILTIEETREAYGKQLLLALTPELTQPAHIDKLQKVLRKYPGSRLPVNITYRSPQAECILQLQEPMHVKPTDDLFDEIRELLGNQAVKMEYYQLQ